MTLLDDRIAAILRADYEVWWALQEDCGTIVRNVCPRCANGRPGCSDRKPDGSYYAHAETCALYEWADDVCSSCEAEMARYPAPTTTQEPRP